jgi:mannose/fructose/N-acetylgalactosamine-specific phosphotransferase system component IID
VGAQAVSVRVAARGDRRPRAVERRRIALRSNFLQAVWNYETLQSVGFAWSILPGLTRLYPDPVARGRRILAHLEVFNSNPYVATLAMGVALRIEEEIARGAAGAEQRLARLLKALRATLGAIGDELFWVAWRPALGLAAAVAALATSSPWVALVFLVTFNVLAQTVRWRGVRAGFASGAGIARVLQDPFWRGATEFARTLGAIAGGAALGAGAVAASNHGGDASGVGVFLILAVLLWLAGRLRVGSHRPLSPSLVFLAFVFLLSVLFQLRPDSVPW